VPENAPLISHYELQPEPIAKMLARRFLSLDISEELRQTLQERLEVLEQVEKASRRVIDIAERKAYFCSGCPHNSSTVVPVGSRALGGIGCHFLALSMDRGTETFTQMGGDLPRARTHSRRIAREHGAAHHCLSRTEPR
jgi:indolepyruvate ferredoxin oxidoreductase